MTLWAQDLTGDLLPTPDLGAKHILAQRVQFLRGLSCCRLGQQLVEGEIHLSGASAAFSSCTRSWQVRLLALLFSSF